MQSRREYGILAPEELEGDPDDVGTQVRGDGHRATRGAEDQGRTETDTGDETGQNALIACGRPPVNGGERRPLNGSALLTHVATKGGGGGGGPSPGSTYLRRADKGRRGTPRHGSTRL